MENNHLNYLDQLEAESIHIIREAVAECKAPVMLYSIGKDSSVLLHLARKAFAPGPLPFPLLHVDTGYKFREMYQFRDYFTKKIGARLIVRKNEEPDAAKMNPAEAHTDTYIYYKKTKPLLAAIKEFGFDIGLGGARREEEKSRAKERIFSVRSEFGVWDPKSQRPELWNLYNTKLNPGQNFRVFPLSNWTELDIWRYIEQEQIEVVPLYFAKKRRVVERNSILVEVNEHTRPVEDEAVLDVTCRFRTLGCSPSTGAVISSAKSVKEIIAELEQAVVSERQTRAIDASSDSAMEDKKKEGYF